MYTAAMYFSDKKKMTLKKSLGHIRTLLMNTKYKYNNLSRVNSQNAITISCFRWMDQIVSGLLSMAGGRCESNSDQFDAIKSGLVMLLLL